ncbi:hypothetical protein ACFWM3_07660 [Gottfriedia sp. NPDC058432]|uniref:hypothetical protein n=1 Tax=Bacillaceae TaxID=186817 RepID=UPI000A9241A3|nr:hypothetical protein [Bacillus sp. FJAT-25509]
MKKNLNKIIMFLSAFSLFLLLVQPGSTEAASKPTLKSLEKNYNSAVQKLFFWSSLNDQFSLGSLIVDISSKAYDEYKSLTLSSEREYSKTDFVDNVTTITKVGIQSGSKTMSKTVTIPMRVYVYKKYLKANSNLKDAEKKLRKYYPNEAKCIIDNKCKRGSGGGGADRKW